MAETNITIPEKTGEAASQAPEGAPEAASQAATEGMPGLLRYIAQHLLFHDGQEFQPGAIFQSADQEIIATLRASGAIKLESELQDAGVMAEQAARTALENADLKARIAELEALMSGQGQKPAAGGKGGK